MNSKEMNSVMGPGAVVVSADAREVVDGKMTSSPSYPRGVVHSADWSARTCVVEWPDGKVSTHDFPEVDVVQPQTAVLERLTSQE